MKKIIYTRPDGGLSVIHPIRNTLPDSEHDLSDEQILERAMKDVEPGAINVRVIDASEIPTDRSFRNAWKDDGVSIAHDMEKCRSIHRDRLRSARKEKLAALDVAYMLADEKGDGIAKNSIAKQKQALRDITKHPSIEAAMTPEELKTAALEVLA